MKIIIILASLIIVDGAVEARPVTLDCDEAECRLPVERAKEIRIWQIGAQATIAAQDEEIKKLKAAKCDARS